MIRIFIFLMIVAISCDTKSIEITKDLNDEGNIISKYYHTDFPQDNLMSKHGFKSKPKSVKQIWYIAIEKDGKIIKGDKYGSGDENTIRGEENSDYQLNIDKRLDIFGVTENVFRNGLDKIKNVEWKGSRLSKSKNNKQGYKIWEQRKFLHSPYDYKWVFKYNSNAKVIKCNSYRFSSKLLSQKGLTLNEEWQNKDGKLYGQIEHKYNTKGNIIESIYENIFEQEFERNTYKYDKNANLIEERQYDFKGNLLEKTLYEYNQYDNIIKKTYFKSDKKSEYIRTYTYKYDDKNNWIERVYFEDGKVFLIIEREIEY